MTSGQYSQVVQLSESVSPGQSTNGIQHDKELYLFHPWQLW